MARDIAELIRAIPDYPKPGIMFRDVTTLFGDADGLRRTIELLTAPYAEMQIDAVAGIEARGFILGGAVADRLHTGFVPIRKKGKLPSKAIGQDYELEYGTDIIEIHVDAVRPGQRVLLIDDLIATGGTAEAAVKLLRRIDAEIVGAAFIVDLPFLEGAEKLRADGVSTHTLVAFEGE
ncbi:MAG: adenine phosphoribosyltransferase [Pseudomonadota bacterium]